MTRHIHLLTGTCCLLLIVSGSVGAEDGGGAPAVGQVRTLAVNRSDVVQLRALARDGWVEATGQLLPTHAYDALYHVIGRTWTPAGVPPSEFALPDLDEIGPPSPNPSGVLGNGDLVTGGESRPATRPALLHFIYVGTDASAIAETTTSSGLASSRR
jgi:microcystin-dependent protein